MDFNVEPVCTLDLSMLRNANTGTERELLEDKRIYEGMQHRGGDLAGGLYAVQLGCPATPGCQTYPFSLCKPCRICTT
jgi:hypothetical protein